MSALRINNQRLFFPLKLPTTAEEPEQLRCSLSVTHYDWPRKAVSSLLRGQLLSRLQNISRFKTRVLEVSCVATAQGGKYLRWEVFHDPMIRLVRE